MNSRTWIRQGALLALATAVVSGVSIFVNSLGVQRVADPFVFTSAKNVVVAVVLAAAVVLPFKWRELRNLDRPGWGKLAVLGLVGGGVPFLLFFYGLKLATAPSAAFLHKTLFIWVALLAAPLLKERVGVVQVLALAGLVLGNLVLGGLPSRWAAGRGELLVLIATLLWAAEAVLARRFLRTNLSASTAAFGRMGFGALVMVAFLASSGRLAAVGAMDAGQWGWVLLTAAFLVVYVLGYYGALKRAPATLVTSVLVFGSVITSALSAIFHGASLGAEQVAGLVVVSCAAALWLCVGRRAIPTHRIAQEAAGD